MIHGPTAQREFIVDEQLRSSELQFSRCGEPLSTLELSLSVGVAAATFDGSVREGQIRLNELGPLTFVSRLCPAQASAN